MTARCSSSRRRTSASGRSSPAAEPREHSPPPTGHAFRRSHVAERQAAGGPRDPPTDDGTCARHRRASPSTDGGVTALVGGSDFLAQPGALARRRSLAWIAWNHPDMPWDRAELRVGRLEDGMVAEWTHDRRRGQLPAAAGLDRTMTTLLYADDTTGRWNLWRRDIDADLHSTRSRRRMPTPVARCGCSARGGSRSLEDGRIVAVRTHGDDELVLIDRDGAARSCRHPSIAELSIEDVHGYARADLGRVGRRAQRAVGDRPPTGRTRPMLVRGGRSPWGREWMPRARAVTVRRADADPCTPSTTRRRIPRARAPEGERPPYLVYVHGGPTAHAAAPHRPDRVLHQPRHRRARRELRRLQRVRPGLPRAPARAVGHRRRRRRRRRGVRARRRPGAADPARLDDRRRLRRRLDGAGRARRHRRLRRRHLALRGRRCARAGRRHPRLRGALSGRPDRPAARGRGAVHRAVAAVASRPVPRAAAASAGARKTRWCRPRSPRRSATHWPAHGIPHAYVVYEGEGHGFRRAENVVHAARERTGVPRRGVRLRHSRGPAELAELERESDRERRELCGEALPRRARAARCRSPRASATG